MARARAKHDKRDLLQTISTLVTAALDKGPPWPPPVVRTGEGPTTGIHLPDDLYGPLEAVCEEWAIDRESALRGLLKKGLDMPPKTAAIHPSRQRLLEKILAEYGDWKA